MKKIIVFLFILTIFYLGSYKEEVVIPTSSIRYRIIANSNDIKDQMLKLNIKEQINKEIMPILMNATSIGDARDLIVHNINAIEQIVSQYTDDFSVHYGQNYFPEKSYKGINYQEGEYESLVIELGEGLGENWWCVLYPPLCLIDEQQTSDAEYTTLVKEVIQKF